MPDLRSVRKHSSDRGGARTRPAPLSQVSPFSTHWHTATRSQKPFPPGACASEGALITLAAGRRTVPSMHFSRPRRHDRPAVAAPRGRRGGGCALGRPPPPCEPLRPPRGRRRGAWRGGRVDAQADMPLDEPRAQVAFKDSMIRGILQFTLRIAFRCVLHRCKSQDIRC